LMKQRYWMSVVLASLCLGSLFALTHTYSAGLPVYDPWADINDDGWVNAKDAIVLGNAFSSSGTPLEKASITFDSGWINITDKCEQNIVITHGLNSTDLIVDITGKTALDGGVHQKHLGLTCHTSGWSKTYGGTGSETGWDLVETSDGGYAVAGENGGAFWLVKTDAWGNEQWNKRIEAPPYAQAQALIQTSDGGYALAGAINNGWDGWVVKTDANGNALWNRTYGEEGEWDALLDIIQTGDGGYALTGFLAEDFCLIKIDGDGYTQWSRRYEKADWSSANSLIQTSDGGYALAGEAYYSSHCEAWLVKTDNEGNAQWNMTYGELAPEIDGFADLVQTADGGYALAGRTASFGAGGTDYWLVKTNADGVLQWNRTYGGMEDECAMSIVNTYEGGYVLAGRTASFGAGEDFWLVKTDSAGNAQWSKSFGGTNNDYAWSAIQTSDGGYVLTGSTESFGAGSRDLWLVKTEFESGLAWIDSAADTITLYRGATDAYWNYVRVRIWQPKQ